MPFDDLKQLPDDHLLSIARNPSAIGRQAALRILVERGSHHACHPELIAESRALILSTPVILKIVDPAGSHRAGRLPGLVDVVENHLARTTTLENTVAEVDERHSMSLSDAIQHINDKLNQEASDRISSVRSLADREELKRAQSTVILGVAIIRANRALEAAEARLWLLERSVWRKVVDWTKRTYARVIRKTDNQ